MGLRVAPVRRFHPNLSRHQVARAYAWFVGASFAASMVAGCANMEALGDKEESARQSGKGAVVGIHQGLDAVDDPLLAKLRKTLLDDETLHRAVAQIVEAAVVGARQGMADINVDAKASAIIDAIASTLGRQTEQTAQKIIDAASAKAYATSVRSVRDSITAAADSFAASSPQMALAMRTVVEASVAAAADTVSERLEKKTVDIMNDVMNSHLPQFVGVVSRTAAREAVGGFRQGLAEEFPELFLRKQFWTDWVQLALIAVSSMLLLLVIAAAIVIAWLVQKHRSERDALHALSRSVEAHGSPDLKAALHRSTPGTVRPGSE